MYREANIMKKIPQEEIRYIIEEYKKGKPIIQLAKELKRGQTTIRRLLENHNIPIISKRNQTGEIHKSKELFKKIETEADAYWLGMLYADGSIRERGDIILDLKASDIDTIKAFRDYCGENRIREQRRKYNDKIYISYAYSHYNKKTVDNLIKLGCYPNKSLILKCPTEEQVPQHLFHHFVRGYFDGDGSIRWKKSYKDNRPHSDITILGTEEFLEGICKRMKWKYKHLYVSGKIFSVRWGTQEEIKKIANDIYKDATIYMKRKYDIYKEIN